MSKIKKENLVQRDCKPFLSVLGAAARPLYRGMSEQHDHVTVLDVRRDRQPKNMPRTIHAAADSWFSEKFGVRYRGAGLFCTGDRAQAAEHGYVYKIFPIGGFQFCWSPGVRDLSEWAKREGRLQLPPADFVAALDSLDYREEGLAEALASGCEVMVACRSYYAVPDYWPEPNRLR
ncbi:hypothetical protein GCM10028794_24070 [Silanimonas algicola]